MHVAAIGYRNAEPLVRGLPWEIARLLPASMTADRLRDYDLVLAPVMLALANPDWEILRESPAIGCCGAVGSVRLECAPGCDIASATRFAFSPESQTSNCLLKILLAFYWHRALEQLQFVDRQQDAHAYVVIGDRALQEPAGPGAIDLGGTWHTWTGLPFVFACWMRRPGVNVDQRMLCQIRDTNLADLQSWLPAHSVRATHLHHFTQQLKYDFGPSQHQGLATFREYVRRLSLAP